MRARRERVAEALGADRDGRRACAQQVERVSARLDAPHPDDRDLDGLPDGVHLRQRDRL